MTALATRQHIVGLVPGAGRKSRWPDQEDHVALARKLLIAIWRSAKDGVIPEGAKMKMA